MRTTHVPINTINVSAKKLRKLSQAKIAKYVQCYDRGDSFPPITVEDNGGFYTIRDGRHRYQAQLRAGFAMVEVSVY